MKKLLFIIIVLTLFTFGGCGCGKKTIEEQKYLKDMNKYTNLGVSECNKRGMKYAGVFMGKFDEWKVICFTKSPVKHFSFGLP